MRIRGSIVKVNPQAKLIAIKGFNMWKTMWITCGKFPHFFTMFHELLTTYDLSTGYLHVFHNLMLVTFLL